MRARVSRAKRAAKQATGRETGNLPACYTLYIAYVRAFRERNGLSETGRIVRFASEARTRATLATRCIALPWPMQQSSAAGLYIV